MRDRAGLLARAPWLAAPGSTADADAVQPLAVLVVFVGAGAEPGSRVVFLRFILDR
jgi:hypothetical protein